MTTHPRRHPLAYGHVRPVQHHGRTLYFRVTTVGKRIHYGEVWDTQALHRNPLLHKKGRFCTKSL